VLQYAALGSVGRSAAIRCLRLLLLLSTPPQHDCPQFLLHLTPLPCSFSFISSSHVRQIGSVSVKGSSGCTLQRWASCSASCRIGSCVGCCAVLRLTMYTDCQCFHRRWTPHHHQQSCGRANVKNQMPCATTCATKTTGSGAPCAAACRACVIFESQSLRRLVAWLMVMMINLEDSCMQLVLKFNGAFQALRKRSDCRPMNAV
jgi:hypothetical protein